MLKKFITVILIVGMMMSMMACGGSEKTSTVEPTESTETEIIEDAAEAEPEIFVEDSMETDNEQSAEDAIEAEPETSVEEGDMVGEALNSGGTSMKYKMSGVDYEFPTPVTEFLANGWTFDEEFDLAANESIETYMTQGGGPMIRVTVKNDTAETISCSEGLVTWVYLSQANYIEEVVLPEYEDVLGQHQTVFEVCNIYNELVERASEEPVDEVIEMAITDISEDGRQKVTFYYWGKEILAGHVTAVELEYN